MKNQRTQYNGYSVPHRSVLNVPNGVKVDPSALKQTAASKKAAKKRRERENKKKRKAAEKAKAKAVRFVFGFLIMSLFSR